MQAIEQSGFRELMISARHAAKVHELPLYHRDPFDRLLTAQALTEGKPQPPLHARLRDYVSFEFENPDPKDKNRVIREIRAKKIK